jgi:hypothetical protein
MDIRDALTATYLAQFFDTMTLLRAREYVAAVEDLVVAHETSGSLTATATVPGTAPVPYVVQFHAEVDESSDWVFSSCSCPVARMCKHGAAVALCLRGPRPPATSSEPPWRRQLGRIGDEIEATAKAALTGQALGLELVRRPASRWSRSPAGELTMRPVRPGARRGWARSGAEWSEIAGHWTQARYVPAQVEALQVLHRGLVARQSYYVTGAAPTLDEYDDRMVPAVRAAVAAGVTLVAGAGLASVAVSERAAEIVAEVTDVDGKPTLEVWVEVDGRRHRGDCVVPIGRPVTAVAIVEDDAALLAELSAPASEPLLDLLLGPPVVATADDTAAFLEAVAPLARRIRVESASPSLALPAAARPRLHLRITWRSATEAGLTWRWAYGEQRCALAGTDVLGGLRDPAAESEILREVPDALLAATRRLPAGSGSGQTLIQVIGGTFSLRLPTRSWVWLTSGLRPVDRRDEEWLKRGLPSS